MTKPTLALTTALMMAMVGGSTIASELKDINELDDFTKAFNEAQGTPRLVLLVSPT